MARTKKHTELDELLTARNERMQKLQGIVKEAIEEQELIINNLANPPHEAISRGQKLADKVASFGGYAQSKWVAEKLVRQAGERGIPHAIYRPGLVSGHSISGEVHPGAGNHRQ